MLKNSRSFFAKLCQDHQVCHQHTTNSVDLRDRQTYSHAQNREQEHVTNLAWLMFSGKKSSDYMNRGCSCHWGDGYRPNQPKFMCSRSGTVNKQGCKDRLELRYMRLFWRLGGNAAPWGFYPVTSGNILIGDPSFHASCMEAWSICILLRIGYTHI